MTNKPQQSNKLESILETLSAESFIFGNFTFRKNTGIPLPDSNHELPPVEKAKQQIINLVNEIIGENEMSEGFPNYDGKVFTKGNMIEHDNERWRNLLRAEQRNRLTKLLGGN